YGFFYERHCRRIAEVAHRVGRDTCGWEIGRAGRGRGRPAEEADLVAAVVEDIGEELAVLADIAGAVGQRLAEHVHGGDGEAVGERIDLPGQGDRTRTDASSRQDECERVG